MPVFKEAERRLPRRAYERLESFAATICLPFGAKLSSSDPDVIPDNLAGRTDVGQTFEDFHLFWPIRPKNWLNYPEDKNGEVSLGSREYFFLREEQKAYVDIDNSVWLGQRQQTSPHQILANELYYNQQKKIAPIYNRKVDLRGNMQIHTVNPDIQNSAVDSRFREFWDAHPDDLDIFERRTARNAFSRFTFAGFTSYAVLSLLNPSTAILALPVGIFIGGTAFPLFFLVGGKLSGAAGHSFRPWERRVADGLIEYAEENNIPLESKSPITFPWLRNKIFSFLPNQFGDQRGTEFI